ncbi:zinc finger CCCH domain-containing protein 11A [Rhinophrynus dorsalis]
MSNQGDDCYFYFYSTCTKGDSCPFRHCEAAIGNETVCTLWQEGRCFRQVCKFRHMEMDKKRSEIPCYWENQLSGCQKSNCAFHHVKGRFVDGVFLPPSKTHLLKPEPSEADPPASQLSVVPNKLPVAPTPQLRGVMEATENVPSPTHPPVVINAADDDEDDDDQFSEEGEEIKNSGQQHLSPATHQGARVISTRKTPTPKKINKDEGLNFGIKTLEEIKSKKLKEREGSPVDAAPVLLCPPLIPVMSERETVVRTVTFASKSEQPNMRLSLAQRLGKRKEPAFDIALDIRGGESLPPVKKSLSERLGSRIAPPTGGPDAPQKRVQIPRPLKERLGLPAEQNSMETETAANPTSEIRIKTLQEIRQEKANQRKKQGPAESRPRSEDLSVAKRVVATKPQSGVHIKTFSEIQAEKRQRQLKEETRKFDSQQKIIGQGSELPMVGGQGDEMKKNSAQPDETEKVASLVETTRKLTGQAEVKRNIRSEKEMAFQTVANVIDSKNPSPRKSALSLSAKDGKGNSQPIEKVRVKTLEEIRREKALRLQQAVKPQSEDAVSQSPPLPSRKRVLRLSKPKEGADSKVDTSLTESSPPANQNSTEEKSEKTPCLVPDKPSIAVPVKPSPVKQKVEENHTRLPPTESQAISSTASLVITKVEETIEPETATEEIPEKKPKGKPKLNVEPHVVRKRSPAKSKGKRKTHEKLAVAAVRPLSPTTTSSVAEQTPNKATIVPVTDTAIPEEHPVISPPSTRSKHSTEPPICEPDLPSTAHAPVKSRRTSTASAGKQPPSAEDDFDKLIWEISGGKLEAEIDLDPSKDEDDLLLELSEMIDS